MLCAEPNFSALIKNLETSKRLLGVESIRVRQPMPGLVEIVGYDADPSIKADVAI